MVPGPLTAGRAKAQLRWWLEEGVVEYSRHFREELAKDHLTMEDVLAVSRSGAIVMAPEQDIRTGQWKYRIEGVTADQRHVAVVFCFRAKQAVFYYGIREEVMSRTNMHECTNCGEQATVERRNYRYAESGLSNVVLQDIEVADCPKCGNSDVMIPRMQKVHRAIAQGIANSPARLTGEQLRFLRKHLGLSGDQLGLYLHTDKTKISKWEQGQNPIGSATDRLVRLLAAALDRELRPAVSAVAEHLREITDESGELWEMHVDMTTLQTAFLCVSRAA